VIRTQAALVVQGSSHDLGIPIVLNGLSRAVMLMARRSGCE